MEQGGVQDTIDLKVVFRKVISKWWLFLITISIALAGGVAYIKTTPKQYRLQAVLRMSEGRRASFGSQREEFLKGSGFLKNESELEDEITMIKSITNITRTLKRLNFGISYYQRSNFMRQELYDKPPFIVKPDTSVSQITGAPIEVIVDTVAKTYRVKAEGKNVMLYDVAAEKLEEGFVPKLSIDRTLPMGQPFTDPYLAFTIDFPKDRVFHKKTSYYFYINSLEGLVLEWRGVGVDPMSEESNIVVLSSSGEVISKQQKFLDALMATYIESEKEKNNKKGEATIRFINAALGKSTEALEKAGGELEAAKGGSGGETAGLQLEIFNLESEARGLQSKLEFLRDVASTLEADGTIAAANIQAPALEALLEQYNRDRGELRSRESTEKQASQQTLILKRRIQSSKESIIQSASSLQRQTELALNQINQQIRTRKGQMYMIPEAEVRTNIAQNKFELTQELNNYLMEKSYEAQIAVNSDQVDKSVVDAARAESPAPIAPDKKVVLGGAFALGLFLPLMFILVRDFFNDRIADVDELKRLSKIPLLATIPTSKRKRITPDEPKSLLAESFRTARINLQYLNLDVAKQVVGMTSSTSGEGKTFCSINLATVMALSGKRTLLIDADMRRPRVHEYLEMPDGAGLSNLLIGECTVDEAIRRTNVQGLDVITAGPVPPNPLELVESPRMTQLFGTLRGRYDHIVVDASPMGLVSEFKIIMGHVDVTLYVVRQGHTRRGMLRMVNDLYRAQQIKNVDLLLNDVKAGDGYGAGYGYYTK